LIIDRASEVSVGDIIKAFLWNLFAVAELQVTMHVCHVDKLTYLFGTGELNLSLIT